MRKILTEERFCHGNVGSGSGFGQDLSLCKKNDMEIEEAIKEGQITKDAEGTLKCSLCDIEILSWKQHCSSEKHEKKLMEQWTSVGTEANAKQNFRRKQVPKKKH